MPDEEERGEDALEELVNEELSVETLMAWDGDPCACARCDCPRFRDGEDDALCPNCRLDDHWQPAE